MTTDSVSIGSPVPCAGALGNDLGWALGAVFRSYVKAAGAVMADLPAGPRGYQVLAAAAHDSPGTQLALAAELGIDRTVMTHLIDTLEAAGLVSREADPADRRARRIRVTKHGAGLLADLDSRLGQVEAHVLAALAPDERTTFRSLLRRVATQVDALDPGDVCGLAARVAEEPEPSERSTRRR